jgi:hypothetical protein
MIRIGLTFQRAGDEEVAGYLAHGLQNRGVTDCWSALNHLGLNHVSPFFLKF